MSAENAKTIKPTTQQFYEAIKKEYFKMSAVKDNGIRVYSEEYILSKVAAKFFRSPRTVENIVYGRV